LSATAERAEPAGVRTDTGQPAGACGDRPHGSNACWCRSQLWITRAYLHGVIMTAGAHRWPSIAGLGHLVTLIGVPAVLVATGFPGVGCAGIALVTGVAAETAITTYASQKSRSGRKKTRRSSTSSSGSSRAGK
jgi:hypothetical protein